MVSDYTALDLETTGLDPKRDKIIEIGAVKVRDGKVAERFQSFVDPGRALEEHVRELTGIGNGMLEGAPDMGELLEPLLAFLGDDVLVEHRILFDYSFVKKEAVNRGIVFEKKGIDTLKLAGNSCRIWRAGNWNTCAAITDWSTRHTVRWGMRRPLRSCT